MELIVCPRCGQGYRGRSGGHCAGCCRTFASTTSADAHRRGDYDGGRYCVDPTLEEGWRTNRYGEWTNSAPMDSDALARRRGVV